MKLLSKLPRLRALALLCMSSALFAPAAVVFAADAATILADKGRPAADVARDADRKPAEMLAFANVQPGQSIVDFMPGKGYFTRIFSTAVGEKGAVYAVVPQLLIDKYKGKALPPAVSAEPGRGNVHEAISTATSLHLSELVDLVWTSQNYHDIHIWAGAEGTGQLNKAIYDALKPGGLYVIVDHAGTAGLDDAGMSKLHRIDEAQVKQEVVAAGFVFDSESKVLRNPDDPRSANVFDPSIRGKTDQFILRFHKPDTK